MGPIELLELWDALRIPREIPPHSLNVSRLLWEGSGPVGVGLRLAGCAGGFVGVKSVSSLHATVSGKLLGSNVPHNGKSFC